MNRIISTSKQVLGGGDGHFRRKVGGLYIFLAIFNVAVWAGAIFAFAGNAVLFGAAILAYTFGLRHAFDADHIASIDSVTRKLMQQGKRPATVGFHFAIGHSMALVVFVLAVAGFAGWGASGGLSSMAKYSGIASTFVSASFLLVMAVINLTIARATFITFKRVRNGGSYVEEDFDVLLNKRGFLSRIFRPLFRLVNDSWHMLPIGFLFGLGFDTVTEVSLLGIAGAEAAKGLSLWLVLLYPALFAAGMALMDTTDGILMVRAYGWAYKNPIRKLFYNLSITMVSAIVAIVVAGIEVFALAAEEFHLNGAFWGRINELNEHWEEIGILVVSIFIASWLLSAIFYHIKRYDENNVEAKSNIS
ncbi:MAG: HoxN/HupN/NixA family nickel/cobalt transporter [Rhodomicrobium sp.]